MADNFTDKSAEVLKAAFDKAAEQGNSAGEYTFRLLLPQVIC